MNEYEVTFINGDVVEIEAWTPEAAERHRPEDAELEGRSGKLLPASNCSRPGILNFSRH